MRNEKAPTKHKLIKSIECRINEFKSIIKNIADFHISDVTKTLFDKFYNRENTITSENLQLLKKDIFKAINADFDTNYQKEQELAKKCNEEKENYALDEFNKLFSLPIGYKLNEEETFHYLRLCVNLPDELDPYKVAEELREKVENKERALEFFDGLKCC